MSRYDDYYNKLIFRIKYPVIAEIGAIGLSAYAGFYIKALDVKQKFLSNNRSSFIYDSIKKENSIVPVLSNQQFAKDISNLQPCSYDVSIIVPCFNVEQYIIGCIDSILNQVTSYRYQLIIVNDGSTDSTETLLSKYESLDQVTIIKQTNHGIAYARNRGMEMAKGSYYLFVDSDDRLAPGILETLVSCANQHHADIVDANYAFLVNEQAYPASNHRGKRYNIDLKKNPEFILEIEGYPWMKLFSRELFNGIEWPENYEFEDTMIRMTVLRRAKRYCHINQVGYYYRKHDKSSIHKLMKHKTNLDAYEVVEYLYLLNQEIGLAEDETYYYILLLQLSKYLYPRIEGLPKERQYMVLMACKQLLEHVKECKPSVLPKYYKVIDQIIQNQDWNAWRGFSKKV